MEHAQHPSRQSVPKTNDLWLENWTHGFTSDLKVGSSPLSSQKNMLKKANDGNCHWMGSEDEGSCTRKRLGILQEETLGTQLWSRLVTRSTETRHWFGESTTGTLSALGRSARSALGGSGGSIVKRCGATYREKSTEFGLQTLILLLDQSPSSLTLTFLGHRWSSPCRITGPWGTWAEVVREHPTQCPTLTGTPKQPLDFTQVH